MGLETGTYVNDLNTANPGGTDAKSQGDDHIRLLKTCIKNSFPFSTMGTGLMTANGAAAAVSIASAADIVGYIGSTTVTNAANWTNAPALATQEEMEAGTETALRQMSPLRVKQAVSTLDASEITYTPAGAGAVDTTTEAKLRESVSVKDYGAVGDGVTDDTAAIQATLDYAFTNGGTVHIPPGIYCVTGLKVYGIFSDNASGTVVSGNATNLIFDSGAILKMTSTSGFVIRTAKNPTFSTAPFTDDELLYGNIINPIIDMNRKGDAAILLEAAHYWKVTGADIRNVPDGTFSYDDGAAVSNPNTYPKSGIIIKGITGIAGAYSSEIDSAFIRGAIVNNVNVRGQCGIYLSATGSETDQRANFNKISQGTFTNLITGVDIAQGFNQTLDGNNFFDNYKCIRVNTARNAIIKPYIESSTTGIEFTSNSGFNTIYNLSSVASTITPISDSGVDNGMFPENYFPRFGGMSTSGGGTSNQSIPNSTWTKVLLDYAIASMTQGNIASITDTANSRFIIDDDGDGEGLYLVLATLRVTATAAGQLFDMAIYKNGSTNYPYTSIYSGASGPFNIQLYSYVYLEKNEYIELYIRQITGGAMTIADSIQNQMVIIKQMTNLNKPLNR